MRRFDSPSRSEKARRMTLLGIARFRFHEGRVDDFKRLSRRCMELVQERDTGTLRYEIYLNADETEAVVIEEYVDLAALAQHGANLGEELSSAIIATGDVEGELLGEVPEEVGARLPDAVQPFAPFLSKREQLTEPDGSTLRPGSDPV